MQVKIKKTVFKFLAERAGEKKKHLCTPEDSNLGLSNLEGLWFINRATENSLARFTRVNLLRSHATSVLNTTSIDVEQSVPCGDLVQVYL